MRANGNPTLTSIVGFRAPNPDLMLTLNRAAPEKRVTGRKTLEARIDDRTARVEGDLSVHTESSKAVVDVDLETAARSIPRRTPNHSIERLSSSGQRVSLAGPQEGTMLRTLLAAVGLAAVSVLTPVTAPLPAAAQVTVTVEIGRGTYLGDRRRITCAEGEALLRRRGFRDIRRLDCRLRYFVYRASRGRNRYEIAIRARDGQVVDFRWLRRI